MEEFPLKGVTGVIAESASQVAEAVTHKLNTVEVRADLLLDAGLTLAEVLDVVVTCRTRELNCLFTLRHPTHGGKFSGSEQDRIEINERALAAGAQVIDLEVDTPAAQTMLAKGAPVLLSHHDFSSMPDSQALSEITARMMASNPLGMKVVPTAATIGDATRMLEWVAGRDATGPYRIGFAMGASGACSRVLALAYGSPITYASFGDSVAPGQVALRDLKGLYRAETLTRHTRVYGIAGDNAFHSLSPQLHNPAFSSRGVDAVYLSFQTNDFEDLCGLFDRLSIDGLSVTTPFKEKALAIADSADERSRACGASNTLIVERGDKDTKVHAYNTDFDGVLLPIAAHLDTRGLRVAVIGNGGAARGAVMALKSGGAEPQLFYRNAARGAPVAAALGVPGATLADITEEFDVYLNATTLGTHHDDPSPVPGAVFKGHEQLAFEMIYHNPKTAFLRAAAAAGAKCVRGAEMLVAQGTQQFALFSGHQPSLDEFAGYIRQATSEA